MRNEWLLALLLCGCLGEMDPQPRAARWNRPPRRVPAGSLAVTPPEPRPEVDLPLLRRGQERYGIYCAACHGPLGDGRGEVVRRGFPQPPSFHEERLRQAADEHFYSAIRNGAGRMWPYADRLPERDRWAVVAYLRALQLSRRARLADLPDEVRRQAEERLR
ncbi:MAG: cytochrome c [Candidatus Eremiobacteraeota bacterium]|nr:cytochrome c [Candidatus Eremiobacteraeota bacterium]MCW5869935.1 cytochrome c [Candidatus Eremiobacteraeota bacterium]